MVVNQYLYQSTDEWEKKIHNIDKEKECLVQVFTCMMEPDDAVLLAKEIKKILPLARIIGSSVSGIIYKGEQYDNHTLIMVEQYEKSAIQTTMIPYGNQDFHGIVENIYDFWKGEHPKLLRLFMGAYYDDAHQVIEELNVKMPSMQIAGGMSGELFQSKITPFVFTEEKTMSEALIFAGVMGDDLSVYSRINTAHEVISPVYTITGTKDRAITTIENETAQMWLQRNLGFLSKKQYNEWEDIAANDPLIRFQLALESHNRSMRFLHYDEEKNEISQYYSRLEPGTKFRISYTSPAKCVEECKDACLEIQNTSIEHLFCYNCLMRKLYLKNCAQWELTPYHLNPISGVFLLGEFGYSGGANTLLNGSCVFSGLAEQENYLTVDLDCLKQLDSIQNENEGLIDFIVRKQKQTQYTETKTLLSDVISHENSYQSYMYRDQNLNMNNMLKYELDKDEYGFNKICLMKIDNAEVLMSYMGQRGYYNQLNIMMQELEEKKKVYLQHEHLHIYAIHADTFVIAANQKVEIKFFMNTIVDLEQACNEVQTQFSGTLFLMRFVVVHDHDYLLEQAYSQLQIHNHSQSRFIIGEAVEKHKIYTREEIEDINLIQYALTENKIIPYYQGIYNNTLKKIDKYEALMRVCNQKGEIVSPFQYMEVAKKYRLYLDLNLKMFEAVLDDFSQIDCQVNINLSAHDITSPKFREVMHQRLKTFHKPSNITFEILEDEYFTDMKALKEFIVEVRAYGVKIAIDDFGSGYSNLLEIVKIRPDYLKINGQIICDVDKNYENQVIVDVITSMGEKLDIGIVAEYVEDVKIQTMLEEYSILYSQGYYFSKPQPFEEIYKIEKTIK
ncbi:MAG: EAL domain-containing protein [Eubacteriales bacterium]